jgi:hypothetical protein
VVNPVNAPATAEVTFPPAHEGGGGGGVKGELGMLNAFECSCADCVIYTLYRIMIHTEYTWLLI